MIWLLQSLLKYHENNYYKKMVYNVYSILELIMDDLYCSVLSLYNIRSHRDHSEGRAIRMGMVGRRKKTLRVEIQAGKVRAGEKLLIDHDNNV